MIADDQRPGLDRLDNCTDFEKHIALSWISGYNPDAFHKAMDRVESNRKPPRIPEPGLWGVVEAQIGGEGFTFVNRGSRWVCVGDGSLWDWDRLTDPVLVREGLS